MDNDFTPKNAEIFLRESSHDISGNTQHGHFSKSAAKTQMITDDNEKTPKNAEKFDCIGCSFKCSKSSDWDRHISTRKHRMITNDNEKTPNKFNCICGKEYKFASGLSRHKMFCAHNIPTISEPPSRPNSEIAIPDLDNLPDYNDKHIIMELIKQSQDVKLLLLEQNSKIVELSTKLVTSNVVTNPPMAITNSNNNSNNTTTNQFNLNFFLNETCKDAINITDFIENLQIQLKELEDVGKYGYVTGITDIILNRLNKLDVSKRPLHCTDLKRETLYIRNENEWNKDTVDKSALKRVIGKVANENYRTIPKWREEHPECKNVDDKQYDFCIHLMKNSIGGSDAVEQAKLHEKIIKNISRRVVINKETEQQNQ
jgi:hypothetical protein